MDNYLPKTINLSSDIDFRDGYLIPIDKPLEWTSFDVVNKLRSKIRYTFNIKKIKVGHAGTLDPLATGLLLLCTGKFTKSIDSLQGLDKVYSGRIKLGAQTPSYDAESEEINVKPIDHLTQKEILEAVNPFIGEIDQVPPIYSAIKIKGQTSYTLARRGEAVVMKPRKITISDFKIKNIDLPIVDFEVACSKGTYIRSLAHDFGNVLGVGGYLTSLKRESIGNYTNSDGWDILELCQEIEKIKKED
jgi:tRNA pseudouridine55 synthase